MISLILVIFAFVCFCIATAMQPRDYPRVLISAGLAFYMASLFLGNLLK